MGALNQWRWGKSSHAFELSQRARSHSLSTLSSYGQLSAQSVSQTPSPGLKHSMDGRRALPEAHADEHRTGPSGRYIVRLVACIAHGI